MVDEITPAVESTPGASPASDVPTPAPQANPEVDNQAAYWRRKAEEAQKERDNLAADKKDRELRELSEAERAKAERDSERKGREDAERKLGRLEAIADSGLPPEIAAIVPDLPESEVQTWIETHGKPLAEKLKAAMPQILGQATSPASGPGPVSDETPFEKLRKMPDGPEKDKFYVDNRETILRQQEAWAKDKAAGKE